MIVVFLLIVVIIEHRYGGYSYLVAIYIKVDENCSLTYRKGSVFLLYLNINFKHKFLSKVFP